MGLGELPRRIQPGASQGFTGSSVRIQEQDLEGAHAQGRGKGEAPALDFRIDRDAVRAGQFQSAPAHGLVPGLSARPERRRLATTAFMRTELACMAFANGAQLNQQGDAAAA